jgi:hypothetical protein
MHIAFPVAPQTAESAPAGSAEPRSAGSKGTPADQAALVEEQQRALEAREKTVESALESQPVDRNWAQDVASTVSAAMSEPELAGSSIERLDCRSTICRIEISHVDQAARDNFFAAFQLDVHSLPNGMMIPREGANGRPATLAFFSREGTRLPVAANN